MKGGGNGYDLAVPPIAHPFLTAYHWRRLSLFHQTGRIIEVAACIIGVRGMGRTESWEPFWIREDRVISSFWKQERTGVFGAGSPECRVFLRRQLDVVVTKSPSLVVYGRSPNSVLDLVPLPAKGRVSDDAEAFAEHLKQFHEQVRTALERSNQKDCGSCRCTREGKGV
ncbi:hypothetical protein MRB53_036593 [Persea americana]|nr:hypothetical protein MRB53_036731 [Persea americana]KAJ8614395.1 hypothetical protein MRB53_036593 [Persea americana]